MVLMTPKSEDPSRSAQRIAHLKIILAPRDLSDMAPRFGRIVTLRIIHPLGDFVGERRDVYYGTVVGESLAAVVVGDRIGLERAAERAVVHGAVVAQDAACALGQNHVVE